MSTAPVGDTVLFYLGSSLVEAEVHDFCGTGDALQLRVWVDVHGSSGEVLDRTLANIPFSWVREVKPAGS